MAEQQKQKQQQQQQGPAVGSRRARANEEEARALAHLAHGVRPELVLEAAAEMGRYIPVPGVCMCSMFVFDLYLIRWHHNVA